VAAESAVIGQTEIDLGIIPGWGGTQRLSRLVGDETAKRLVFLGERIDASEAADIGLVGEVVADDAFDDRIDELSRELAAKPAFAMRAAKEALNAARDGTQAGGGLAFERRAWSGLFGTHDQREGMAAFLEKRGARLRVTESRLRVACAPAPSPRAIGVHGAGQSPRFINPPEYRRHGPVAAVAPRRADNRERRVPVLRPPDQ